jgi:hypothetical protein
LHDIFGRIAPLPGETDERPAVALYQFAERFRFDHDRFALLNAA